MNDYVMFFNQQQITHNKAASLAIRRFTKKFTSYPLIAQI